MALSRKQKRREEKKARTREYETFILTKILDDEEAKKSRCQKRTQFL